MDRYEKALELARAYYDKDGNAFLDTIFPELKENRDEQIRKAIIKSLDLPFMEAKIDGTDVTYEEAVSWLEKQKEPIPIPDKFSGLKSLMLQYLQSAANRKDDAEIESDTDLWGRKILNYMWKCDEKQKEQKPAEWNEDWREEDIQTRFAFYTYKDEDGVLYLSNVFVEETSRNHGFGTRILRAAEKVAETIGATTISLKVKQDSPANAWYRKNGYGYVAFEDGYDWLEKNLEYMKPNKQEWSEEDTEMYINVASSLRGYACGLENEEHRKHIKKGLDWLENRFKSLCPQPKEEWSEEDRANLNSVLNHLKEYLTKDAYTYYEKWLKSLRPQSKIHYWTEEEIEPIISDYLTGREHYGGMMSRLRCLKPKSHWKPSEEQMSALKEAYESYDFCDGERNALESLYEQLKQL